MHLQTAPYLLSITNIVRFCEFPTVPNKQKPCHSLGMTRLFILHYYTNRLPAGTLSSSMTRFSLSPRSALSSIPQDS